MSIIEYKRDDYNISTDKAKLDLNLIHNFLSQRSYWAQGRSLAIVEKSIEHSLCFGMYDRAGEQIGFARVVTDYATFAWLCDVFILETHRGQNLGKWLIECIINYSDLQMPKRMLLATQDAHELYRRYGNFEELQNAERWMTRSPTDKTS
ncbi:GNAT family N-acetyltransferase [Chloroflexota bacterium]